MSECCTTYRLRQLHAFHGWRAGQREKELGLEPDSLVYLHETLIVTAGVLSDAKVLFDEVSDEWRRFCTQELGFAVAKQEEGRAGS